MTSYRAGVVACIDWNVCEFVIIIVMRFSGESSQDASEYVSPGVELGAVVLTGLLHVVFQGPESKGAFIALASVSWVSYIGWRVRQAPGLWRHWGFRSDNLKASFFIPSIAFVLSMGGMAVWGWFSGHDLWNEHLIPLCLLYPIWGVLQQFLVQALGVLNIQKLFPNVGVRSVVLLGACLFSLVHYPQGWLMLATWVLGLVFIPCYLRHRNLWPLGLYHGWLGTFFYLWVLGQDPWDLAFGAYSRFK